MENQESKNQLEKDTAEFEEILHEVQDLHDFKKFFNFCAEHLKRGEDAETVWSAWDLAQLQRQVTSAKAAQGNAGFPVLFLCPRAGFGAGFWKMRKCGAGCCFCILA